MENIPNEFIHQTVYIQINIQFFKLKRFRLILSYIRTAKITLHLAPNYRDYVNTQMIYQMKYFSVLRQVNILILSRCHIQSISFTLIAINWNFKTVHSLNLRCSMEIESYKLQVIRKMKDAISELRLMRKHGINLE